MNEELSSLRFDGVGKCKGGIFDNVNISGTGKIEGSVKNLILLVQQKFLGQQNVMNFLHLV